MDPMAFLTTRNGLKRAAMHAIAREAAALRAIEQENQARRISSAIARSIAGK